MRVRGEVPWWSVGAAILAIAACGPTLGAPPRGHPASPETARAPLVDVEGALADETVEPPEERMPAAQPAALAEGEGVPPSRSVGGAGAPRGDEPERPPGSGGHHGHH